MFVFKTDSHIAQDVIKGQYENIEHVRDLYCPVFDDETNIFVPFLYVLAKSLFGWKSCFENLMKRASLTYLIDAVNYARNVDAAKMLLEKIKDSSCFNAPVFIEHFIKGFDNAVNNADHQYISFLLDNFNIAKYITREQILVHLWNILNRPKTNTFRDIDNNYNNLMSFKLLFEYFNINTEMLPPTSAYASRQYFRFSPLILAILNDNPQLAEYIFDYESTHNIDVDNQTGLHPSIAIKSALSDPNSQFWDNPHITAKMCEKFNVTKVELTDGSKRTIEF